MGNMDAQTALRRRLSVLITQRGQCAALAREANVTASTVSEWVNGNFYPSLNKLDAIATALGLTVAELFVPPGATVPTTKDARHETTLDRSPLHHTKITASTAFRQIAILAAEQCNKADRTEVLHALLPTPARGTARREPSRRSGNGRHDPVAPRPVASRKRQSS